MLKSCSKSDFHLPRTTFLSVCTKRKYLIEKQNSLEEKLMASNQKDFWKSIGKVGISIERNQSIPWSVIDKDFLSEQ
jgi:hypothetical protein